MSSTEEADHNMIPTNLPLLVLSGQVLFPGDRLSITVDSSNAKNFKLIKNRVLSDADAISLDVSDICKNLNRSPIIGFMSRALSKEDGSLGDTLPMSLIGTAGMVNQVMAVGWPPTFTMSVTGLSRIRVEKLVMEEPYPVAVVSVHGDADKKYLGTPELEEAANKFRSMILKFLHMASPDNSSVYVVKLKALLNAASNIELADLLPFFFRSSYAEKLELLSTLDLMERYKLVMSFVSRQSKSVNPVLDKINGPPRGRGGPYILRIMAKDGSITTPPQHPLGMQLLNRFGFPNPEDDSLQELYNKLKAAQLPPHALKVAIKEFQRIKRLPAQSQELPSLRAYLELMSDLPWSKSSSETLDINKAQKDLDADHYAMEKLKKRVLEYLAVRQLKNTLRGPILCFVGPPGVGKTSIGRSIANTLNREFHRISLGGICHTSDIRGHRRTYLGAMPGRIIQGMKTVGVNNPVILLDEVDKLKEGMQGDPGAALLEVLDPEQNHLFHDHYLNVPFDLSQVMFIATANSVKTIPRALLDRMEVITVEGYTHEEKLHIALRHLIPKQVHQHGLDKDLIQIPADTVKTLIKGYTREAGVRSLERRVGALCRDVAVKVAAKRSSGDATEPVVIDHAILEEILGPPPVSDTLLWSRLGQPGVAVGLSVSPVGGEVLLVEASKMEGDGEIQLTGQLGSVMKESANLALSYLRASAYKYGLNLDSETLSRTDIHVHFPEGSTAKEGPSAGVALIAVLVSLFSNRPVATDVAMTGEISLKGAVLPVGGVRAKVLAAHRMGIRRIILPEKNAKDLRKISQDVKDELTFIFVSHVDEVIQAAFDGGFPINVNPDELEPALTSKL